MQFFTTHASLEEELKDDLSSQLKWKKKWKRNMKLFNSIQFGIFSSIFDIFHRICTSNLEWLVEYFYEIWTAANFTLLLGVIQYFWDD